MSATSLLPCCINPLLHELHVLYSTYAFNIAKSKFLRCAYAMLSLVLVFFIPGYEKGEIYQVTYLSTRDNDE